MYDNGPKPGRNDQCWCGSGKKYKKCHGPIDARLEEAYLDGYEVVPRSLLKTPEEIEGIKRSAEINVGVLDYVAEHIKPGVTTPRSTSGSTTTRLSMAASPPTSTSRATPKAYAPPSTAWCAMAFPAKMTC